MLQPEPRLLKFIKLTTRPRTLARLHLSPAAQALIVYSLIAGRDHEAGDTPETSTALAVRRKQGIFFIHTHGTPPRR